MKISMLTPQPMELQQNLINPAISTDQRASFARILQEQFQVVNSLEKNANDITEKLLLGEVNHLHEVTIAAEKANLALQLTVQIRNKLVEAYQEISRMQI